MAHAPRSLFSFGGFWRSRGMVHFLVTSYSGITIANRLGQSVDDSSRLLDCTSSLARICGSINLAMSAQIFVGGLGAVAPETAAFLDTECSQCAVCESCKGFICRVLR